MLHFSVSDGRRSLRRPASSCSLDLYLRSPDTVIVLNSLMRVKGFGEWFREGESREINPEVGLFPGLQSRTCSCGL